LQNFSPNIIQVTKSKENSWEPLVASMVEEKCSYTGFWRGGGGLSERDRLKDVRLDEK